MKYMGLELRVKERLDFTVSTRAAVNEPCPFVVSPKQLTAT